MAERLTWQIVARTCDRWKGNADPYILRTVALIGVLKDAQARAKVTVDVADAHKRLRSRVGPEFPAADAEREIESIEKAATSARKSARIADFEAAAIEHQLVAVFTAEVVGAQPVMRDAFTSALDDFTTAIASVSSAITDPKAAEKAGQQTAHAWHQAADASSRIVWLWSLARDVREIGATQNIPAARDADWKWTAPANAPMARGRHHVDYLRDAIARGAGPALVTFDELKARIQREAAEAARARTAEVATRGPLMSRPMSPADRDLVVEEAVARAQRSGAIA